MCKNVFKKLIGGEAPKPAMTPAAQPDPVSADQQSADVKDTDVVETSGGREASGRVKLGAKSRRQANVAGLQI